jgi:hypothetical protein
VVVRSGLEQLMVGVDDELLLVEITSPGNLRRT